MSNSLLALVRDRFERQCFKHELAPDAQQWADDRINEMTNVELLEEISDAFEQAVREALYVDPNG